MPHGWRWHARSPASPGACVPDASAGISPGVLGPFADRACVDWPALIAGTRDPERRESLDVLRRLDALRGCAPVDHLPARRDPRFVAVGAVIVLAAVQTAFGLAHGLG